MKTTPEVVAIYEHNVRRLREELTRVVPQRAEERFRHRNQIAGLTFIVRAMEVAYALRGGSGGDPPAPVPT